MRPITKEQPCPCISSTVTTGCTCAWPTPRRGTPVPAEASPVREAGIDPDNTRILAQFETQGTATATSSIYAVRYGSSEGDQAVTGLTNEGVNVQDLGRLQDKPAYRIRIEFFVGLAVFGGKAAARLKGVING